MGFRRIGFRVEDIQEVYESLKGRIDFVSPQGKSLVEGGRKILFFEDPNGVEMHFIQGG